jgi:hypothetical protein
LKDLRVKQDQKVPLARLVPKDLRDLKDLRVQQDPKVPLVQLVLKGLKDLKVHKGRPVSSHFIP